MAINFTRSIGWGTALALCVSVFAFAPAAQAADPITGTVTQSGAASEYVDVTLYRLDNGDWTDWDATVTDASGAYSLALPDDATVGETFKVGFDKDGWRSEYWDDKQTLATADEVVAGVVANADLSEVLTVAVTGTVTQNGSASQNATVVAFQDDGAGGWIEVDQATTDAAGKYSLNTDVGSYVIRFSKLGWQTEYYKNRSSITTADPVDAPQSDVDADLAVGADIQDLSGPLTPQDLAVILAGDGVTVSNVGFVGDDRAAGSFERFDPLGFARGIVLSSGAVEDVVGPNKSTSTSTGFSLPGDSQLDALIAPSTTNDASVLTMDFVPAAAQVRFDYVFGSEEYNEYVGDYDDVFAFFVNGKNCAVVPGTSQRVSVNSINLNLNASLYRNNDFGAASPFDVELDGLTVPLTCVADVKAGQANTLKLVIADARDDILDSAVFLQLGSLVVNNPPLATSQTVSTPVNTAKAITLAGTDPDGDALTFAVASQPAHGTLSGTAPNLTYTPAADYNGADSFTFTASDGAATSAPATVSIHVGAGNIPPVATAQSVTTAEDTAKAVTLAGTDPDGDALTFVVASQPAHGTLSGTAPNLTYTPAADYHGADSFTFTANDSIVTSAPAKVSITVMPVNDKPVATAQSVTTAEDTAKAVTLAGTDVDGDALTFVVASQPAHGTLSGTAPNPTYTPAADYNGADSFTFTANDGSATSAPATVSITVMPVDDTPVTPTPKAQPELKPLPKKVKKYSSFGKKAWLKAASVRLPGETTLGQAVSYSSLTHKVCTVPVSKGIARIKGKKVGKCKIRAVAAGTGTAEALDLTFTVKITK